MMARFETAVLNEMTLAVPWENLDPGPSGEYVAVVDQDQHGKQLYEAVDLQKRELLAEDGLTPSDGNPQFHQQMVYAVAMETIRNFERSLGRVVHWSPTQSGYRPKLQMFPHYSEMPNTYYDRSKGVCFGYFKGGASTEFANTWVFTCLSQDTIAHAVTHALLDGMNIKYEYGSKETNALHEAFADMVALFQHFREGDVLCQQMNAIRGDLGNRSTLGAVALQFGRAIAQRDGIRNALGQTDARGKWQVRSGDLKAFSTALEGGEPHQLGDILVAAVFSAFRKIYDARVADLRRIASRGTGELQPGALHPDLVRRFTHEAAKSARHVQDMCIRALDYVPPGECRFGDFLRAVITADFDLYPEDRYHYRVAFLDAFRSYGISCGDVATLSVETLLWQPPADQSAAAIISELVMSVCRRYGYRSMPQDRPALWQQLENLRTDFKAGLLEKSPKPVKRLTGIDLGRPFEVISLHARERRRSDGDLSSQWVIKLLQPEAPDGGEQPRWTGCTLLVDVDTGVVRYLVPVPAYDPQPKRRKKSRQALELPRVGWSPQPSVRRLRVFAFDPILGARAETAAINEVRLAIPWERNRDGTDALEPGPVGEYIEVIDRDPASARAYEPIDLWEDQLIATDGLPPSESNPQFHQQMVYAVAMRTIRTFEVALGRLALWSPRWVPGARPDPQVYVQRLRLYPHALREANAYYSPRRDSILFGYFRGSASRDGEDANASTVFTCLSHDIIAHEVTHALLDGMHRRFSEASNPDVLAFHEAFADLVALFQHFSLPDVLKQQIATTRGDLASQNQLGQLAQQFGEAIGNRGALRSAIGEYDEDTHEWRPLAPDPSAYKNASEPHDRGAILVAAVFDAFLTIYKTRIADLLRIATEGTGILPAGHLHPDLVDRLASEAAKSARHVLDMCVKALDYCPPIDITFSDYLRALVTADFDFNPADQQHRRVAFAEAFRRRGIVPAEVHGVSVDGLLWRPASDAADADEGVVLEVVKSWSSDIDSWNLTGGRAGVFSLTRNRKVALHEYVKRRLEQGLFSLSSIDATWPFEVHSIRPSVRTDFQGRVRFHWIIEFTQRIPQFADEKPRRTKNTRPDYFFRGGCTLVVDAETGRTRYSIKKPLSESRKYQQRDFFLHGWNDGLAATYFGRAGGHQDEPFAVLHRL
jgi:hypothetical protein